MPKRIVVLAAGSISHFVVGFLLIAFILGGLGTLRESTTVGTVSPCVPVATESCNSTSQPSPALSAGLKSGDRIVSINGQEVTQWSRAVEIIRASADKEVTIVVERSGQRISVKTTPVSRERPSLTDPNVVDRNAGVIGISPREEMVRQSPVSAIASAGKETGRIVAASVAGLGSIPSKIPSLWGQAFEDQKRDTNSLVGVYGVARVSGQALSAEQLSWSAGLAYFLYIIAGLNIFIGLFNAVPLPPLDGGHIAVAVVDGVRRTRAKRRGLPEPEPFNITKLAPLTYAVFAALVFLTVLLLAADILNPLTF